MSTKTTFKRIALVAVAALGLGLVSTVSAQAVTGRTATSVVVGTLPAARTGVTSYVPVKVYLPSGTVATDTITINAEITSAPTMGGTANAASNLGAAANAGNDAGLLLAVTDTTSAVTFTGATPVHGRINDTRASGVDTYTGHTSANIGKVASTVPSYPITASDVAKGYISFNVAVKPDVAGSYTVLVSTTSLATPQYTAGDPSANFTLATGSAPTTVTLTNLAGSSILAGSPKGLPVAVALNGALSGLEGITLSTSGSGTLSLDASTYATTRNLTSSSFTNGQAVVWIKDTGTAAETISLTATGTGSLSSSVTATLTYSVTAQAAAVVGTVFEAPSADAVYAATDATITTDAISVTTLSTSQAIGMTVAAAAATTNPAGTYYGYVTVTDTKGKLTGISGLVFDKVYSYTVGTAATGVTLSFAANAAGLADETTFLSVAIPAGGTAVTGTVGLAAGARTITFKTSAPAADAFTISPNSNFLAAPGAAIALTATLEDQYGNAVPNATVTVTTSGRNNPVAKTLVTDSSGKVTFTTADSSTSTTSLVDTVTFSNTAAGSESVTINYSNTTVGTVTVTGGNTTASVTSLTNTTNDIAAGDGAEAGAIDITATVKDALGNALAGVPVTFSVAGTGVAFKSTSATKYTGSTGKAIGSLYAWVAGTYTYTITAGGKTTTGTATFGQTTATEARVISASVDGNVVTGKAVDRFGNPVAGVTLYASTTKPGNIGGLFVATGTTGADGTASWVVTNGGSVVVSAVNPSSVAGTTYGQTCALAGNKTCATAATAATAFTASTTGTATTAETYVGASLAPAGVASAAVEAKDTTASDAADAAAEATDAANAATDAANAAAEAADAATAAAQDAADAVAALSTQVTEMVSALKKQITALTNLVIKIQKKVKA